MLLKTYSGACLCRVCYLGERLLESPKYWHFDSANTTTAASDADWCNKNVTGDIWSR